MKVDTVSGINPHLHICISNHNLFCIHKLKEIVDLKMIHKISCIDL